MYRNVVIALIMVKLVSTAPSPLQVTIDCDSDEAQTGKSTSTELSSGNSKFDVDSFCNLIHNAVPKAIEDGKFVIVERHDDDMTVAADTPQSSAVRPPSGFIPTNFPKPKVAKFRNPRIKIPKLRPLGVNKAPKLGAPMRLTVLRRVLEEETSAERMERFKNGVQRMLHVVKVLGQIDQYLSERTRIVIDKLSKTFME